MDTLATFEPIHRRRATNGDEVDAFSGHRRAHAALTRAGVARKTKTRANRRTRHTARAALRAA